MGKNKTFKNPYEEVELKTWFMETENKYYTPTLEELIHHVISGEDVYGLIHESEEVIQFINKPGLVNLMDFINSSSAIEEGKIISLAVENFRIKNLDNDDIEELGWKKQEGRTTDDSDYNIWSNPKYAEWTLRINDYDGKIWIKFYHPDDGKGEVHFSGIIKNKSELKKVMQMLNIKTREDGE